MGTTPNPSPRGAVTAALAAGLVTAYVMRVVAHHTIELVHARQLLPRWDLATHLGHGWLDYHLLVTGRIHRLLWDLWLQGYWPPGLSLYQVPFYLLLGGDMTAGLWSSAVAFTLAAAVGAAILVRQWGTAGLLPAATFVALMVSSPFLLAYASVTMTEILGMLGQLLVVLAYMRYQQAPGPGSARQFAISLTLLFFIKYNYLLLLAGPLVVHEFLTATSGGGMRRRSAALGAWARRALTSTTGVILLVYFASLIAITVTGGTEFHLLGRRVSIRTIGNSGHLVLYGLLVRVWYLHRRGRIDWSGLMALDPRIRPLLVWFVIPVTIWVASPYPNHLRDVANLVINRPLGESSVQAGIATYFESLRTAYFYAEWVFTLVVVTFAVAALRYQKQPPWMQWLILAIPLQAAAISLHQTRFTRFLLLTVVLLCLVAASEVGRWLSHARRGRAAATLVAPLVVLAGVLAARGVVKEDRFQAAAFEHYTDSAALAAALAEVRRDLDRNDRILIVGQSNDLSPAMFRWELGPPSGVECFPFEAVGAARLEPAQATKILLLTTPGSAAEPLDAAEHHAARRREVLEAVERGDFRLHRVFPVPDQHVTLSLYSRTAPPASQAPCR